MSTQTGPDPLSSQGSPTKTPKTRGERRREWRHASTTGMRYSSRWGEYTAGLAIQDLRVFPREAVLVDPGLTRSERDELEEVLKLHHQSRPGSGASLTVLCVTFLLTLMLVASPLARFFPDAWSTGLPVVAVLLFPVIATLAIGLWFRRKGAIPEKFRGRLLTGHESLDGPYRVDKADVLAVAEFLGDLENTPGTTNAQVDDQWRKAWDARTSATKEDEEKRAEEAKNAEAKRAEEEKKAEEEWAAAPVDPQMPDNHR